MPIVTLYPAVDGRVGRETVTEAWATIRSGSGNMEDDTSASQSIPGYTDNGSVWTSIYRGIYIFNLSSIPAGSTINSATFSVYVQSSFQEHSANQVGITPVTTAANDSLATADYNIANHSTTRHATDKTTASLSVPGYTDFALNATGLTAVATAAGSFYKVAFRYVRDIDNSEPTKVNNTSRLFVSSSETSGTTEDPKLVIDYTPVSGGSPMFFGGGLTLA